MVPQRDPADVAHIEALAEWRDIDGLREVGGLLERVLRVTRPTGTDFLHPSIALLAATFLLSVVFSQVPSLSWFAFGCFLAIVGFGLAVAQIVEDETSWAATSAVIAAAALFLAIRAALEEGQELPVHGSAAPRFGHRVCASRPYRR